MPHRIGLIGAGLLLVLGVGHGRVHGGEQPVQMPIAVPLTVSVAPLVAFGGSTVAAGLPALAYPLAQVALQIDPWGWRYSERRSAWRMHTGVDFAAPQGTPVLAALAGRVVLAESLGGYGLTVMLGHPGGIQTLYAHLDRIDVAVGSEVGQGDALGTVGITGSATGPHLHFELRSGEQGAQAHDPTPLLPPLLPPPDLTAAQQPG
ncbi:MAG: M23 family metallopeptidase [Cyanobacteria bacterium REEB417]|nr:M23 family metallopeptidase [Cyanobacteria bacterium REEB417]